MVKSKWEKIKAGDFFIVDGFIDNTTLLYQKINEKNGYNCVLLNTGELCLIYIPADSNKTFQKVEVTFDITPTN